MEFGLRQIPQISPRGALGHIAVLGPPNDQCRRAMLSQISLISWKPRKIRLKILHETNCDCAPFRRLHQRPRQFPKIGADLFNQPVGDFSYELVAKTLLTDGLDELLTATQRWLCP